MRRQTMMAAVAAGLAAASALAAPATVTAPALLTDSTVAVLPRMSVEVAGSGPDVVLTPGLASSRATWTATATRLRAHYRLHLVQLAGFAGEPARANAGGPLFDAVVADLDAYVTKLPKPPIVIGHSLGGTLGLALAERHPTHLSKLMIVDSLPFYGVMMGGPTATAASLAPMANGMRAYPQALSDDQLRGMMTMMVTAPADVDRVAGWSKASDPGVVANAMADDMLADLRPDLAKVTVPVTVLYKTPLESAITSGYAALGPKTLIAIPDSRHFIMYDQPAKFAAEVDAFLTR